MWERTITVNGFSKAFAMTGWRMGYLAARRPPPSRPLARPSLAAPTRHLCRSGSCPTQPARLFPRLFPFPRTPGSRVDGGRRRLHPVADHLGGVEHRPAGERRGARDGPRGGRARGQDGGGVQAREGGRELRCAALSLPWLAFVVTPSGPSGSSFFSFTAVVFSSPASVCAGGCRTPLHPHLFLSLLPLAGNGATTSSAACRAGRASPLPFQRRAPPLSLMRLAPFTLRRGRLFGSLCESPHPSTT